MKTRSVDAIVQRVRGEYLEMPGLSLTERQAQRLWHLEPEACARSLEYSSRAGSFARHRAAATCAPTSADLNLERC
jgi:hypothetical protein